MPISGVLLVPILTVVATPYYTCTSTIPWVVAVPGIMQTGPCTRQVLVQVPAPVLIPPSVPILVTTLVAIKVTLTEQEPLILVSIPGKVN